VAAEATDAKQALAHMRWAQSASEAYDVAILDFALPDATGLDLAREITDDPALAGTCKVVLAATGERGDARAARLAGVDGYLTKPVREKHLRSCLAAVLGHTSDKAPAALVTRHRLDEEAASRRPHVLLAEDDTINARIAVRTLEKLGYRVDLVSGGDEAVESLGRREYAAVLMDCQMPGMDGYAATAAIRENEQGAVHTPIIAMTASAMSGDRQRCLNAGMDDYLSKPFKAEVLAAVLGKWAKTESTSAPPPAPLDVRPAEVVLDPRTVQELHELVDGDEAFLAELVSGFLVGATETLEELRTACSGDDMTEVARLAHRLKGSSGGFAAHLMIALLDNIEALANAGTSEHLPRLLVELDVELERAGVAWRASSPSP